MPFLYNGRDGVMTDDSGLLYMRARYYNTDLRRFVNQDVLLGGVAEGQTLNRYAYVTGRPVNYVDPFGLAANFAICIPFANACAAAGATILKGAAIIGAGIVGLFVGDAINDTINENNKTASDNSNTQDQARQAEYLRMKNFCDKPPGPTGDYCSDLSKQIDHYKTCTNWYSRWDDKWQPGRHKIKIENWNNRVRNLKEEHKRNCVEKCN